MSINPYEVLGVARTATDAEIKRAYRVKCKEHHPDREHGDAQKMLDVRLAYDILSDANRRARYDATGSTEQGIPLDHAALEMLRSAFTQFLRHPEDVLDPIAELRRAFDKKLRTENENLSKLQKQLAHITRRAKKLKRKGGVDDLFAAICEQHTSDTNRAIEACKTVIAAVPLCQKMLDDYEAEPGDLYRSFLFFDDTSSIAGTWSSA